MLSIRAISKAKFVKCDGNATPGDSDGDLCDHDAEIGHFPLGKEGLKRGCYIPGKKGREFSFEIGYSEYARFFEELYRMVYGVDANGVYKAHRRYQGKPFVEFVDVPCFSDGGTIGPRTCTKLHSDFVAFEIKARQHFTRSKKLAWMWDVYVHFERALGIASDAGFVCYW